MLEAKSFVVFHYEDTNCKQKGVFMNPKTIDDLSIENDEIILLRGKEREESALKVHSSDEVPREAVGMSWLMQNNFDIQVGETVSIRSKKDLYWWQIRKEPNSYIVPTAGKCNWRKIWFFDRGYYI